jgi:hypothetical protein
MGRTRWIEAAAWYRSRDVQRRGGGIRGVSVIGASAVSRDHLAMTRTRHVVVLAMEGCHSLNVLGPDRD